jgi:transposase
MEVIMNRPEIYLGLDVAAETLAAGLFRNPEQTILTLPEIANNLDGFQVLEQWMTENQATKDNTVLCIEATGVYGEALSYYLCSKSYRLAVEPPLKVKRAFHQGSHKTDPVDACQIAEYAYRFFDELHYWTPPSSVLEQVKVLLSVRDHFVGQRTANTNALRALERKPLQTPIAMAAYRQAVEDLSEQIKAIEQEIKRLLNDDQSYRKLFMILTSVTGVGFVFAANLIAITQAFTLPVNYRQLASYCGICPLQHTSGTSVYKKPRSLCFGPGTIRKLLYLSSLSICTHNPQFRQYYLRKVAEGKPKRLVLNNIANKLLKLICALVKEQSVFIPNYRSVNPFFLKSA